MKYILAILLFVLSAFLMAEDTMPDFKLPDLNGNDVTLQAVLNKGPVLVDFWATWCVPCKKSMTALNDLANKYDSLTVVVISIDSPKDLQKARSYLKSMNYNFVALFDSDKKLAKKLNVVNPPRTIIMDNKGVIKMAHDGYEPGAELEYEKIIRELLQLPEEAEETQAEPPAETAPEAAPENNTGCH